MTSDIRQVQLPSGESVPALGQGTWFMGEDSTKAAQEVRALQAGIDCGMTLIDTAEMYADGGSEKVVGKAIAGRRDKVFLVSKVLPWNASFRGTQAACENSLKRLGTDRLDLYLLHWPGSVPLEETVNALEKLVEQGKIRQWGVSNFDVTDLEELLTVTEAKRICTNQVLYNLTRRGIEYDLLGWSKNIGLPTMAYSPIEQGRILRHPLLIELAKQCGVSPAQIALAWVLRRPDIIAIPKTASEQHVRDNLRALSVGLSPQVLAQLDEVFPAPLSKQPLAML